MIYFDNAATSAKKPREVSAAAEGIFHGLYGNPGRGAHLPSRRSAELLYDAREAAAELFGSDSPENVIFTYNDTYALNMAIKGTVRQGDHVLISNFEHNSVLRPVHTLAEKGIISYDVFEYSEAGCTENIKKLIRPETKLLICTHTSNICSVTFPAEDIGRLCRDRGITFILDAAQSAGHIPVDMKKMNIDILCAPCHKGLYGMGGIMLLRDGTQLDTLIEGGSGLNSLLPAMPEEAPERYEAGTVAVMQAAALSAGISFVRKTGINTIHSHECALWKRLYEMLSNMPEIKIYAPEHTGSVMLFNIGRIPSERVAERLDRHGICVRSGFHCSPLGHRTLGTGENGAVRVSFGYFNKERELDRLYTALRDILSE